MLVRARFYNCADVRTICLFGPRFDRDLNAIVSYFQLVVFYKAIYLGMEKEPAKELRGKKSREEEKGKDEELQEFFTYKDIGSEYFQVLVNVSILIIIVCALVSNVCVQSALCVL